MCRSRRELSNEYLLAKFGFDTAENEPCKVCPLSAYRSPRSKVDMGDCFVGPWDIANMTSDILMEQNFGKEGYGSDVPRQ